MISLPQPAPDVLNDFMETADDSAKFAVVDWVTDSHWGHFAFEDRKASSLLEDVGVEIPPSEILGYRNEVLRPNMPEPTQPWEEGEEEISLKLVPRTPNVVQKVIDAQPKRERKRVVELLLAKDRWGEYQISSYKVAAIFKKHGFKSSAMSIRRYRDAAS